MIINKTEAMSTLAAQDGQTVVIGGLIRTKKGKTREGIPFLSSIPILGYLFGYTEDTNEKKKMSNSQSGHACPLIRNPKTKPKTKKNSSVKTTESPSASNQRLIHLFIFASAAILTVIAYTRSLNGPMVTDDIIFLNSSRLQSFFDTLFFIRARVVSDLTFVLNYQISGMSLPGFRIGNIIFHLLTSLSVYFLTSITLKTPLMKDRIVGNSDIISLTAAVLFMLHPIQTSAVSYITQRMAIMAALFSFLGIILYVMATINKGWKSLCLFILSAISFMLAIYSKENAVMVLLVLPLYDFMFLSSLRWQEFRRRFIPMGILVMIIASFVFIKMGTFETIEKLSGLYTNLDKPLETYFWSGVGIYWTTMEYLLTELRIVTRYIFLILFPNPSLMVFDYSNAYPVSKSLFSPPETILSLLFLLSLVVFSFIYIKKYPLISFGILWFIVTISLESFIAVGLDPYFEHRNYLPGFGIFLALSSIVQYVSTVKFRFMKEAILCGIAIVLCILTFARNDVWADEYRFWKDIADKVPQNPRALLTVSYLEIKEGRYKEAEEYLKKAEAVELMSDLYKGLILINHASLLIDTGRYKEAEEYFRKATSKKEVFDKYKPLVIINQASLYNATGRREDARTILKGLASETGMGNYLTSQVLYRLAELYRSDGDIKTAADYLKKAYEIAPQDHGIMISLGLVSRSSGNVEDAIGYFRKSIDVAPDQFTGYIELGDTYFQKGEKANAERAYREAISRAPDMPAKWAKRVDVNLAQLLIIKKEFKEAISLLEKAISADKTFYPPYLYLGNIYLAMNSPYKSIENFNKALSLKDTFAKNDPNAMLVYFNLGMAYSVLNDKKKAAENFRHFIKIAGEDKLLKNNVDKAKEKMKDR